VLWKLLCCGRGEENGKEEIASIYLVGASVRGSIEAVGCWLFLEESFFSPLRFCLTNRTRFLWGGFWEALQNAESREKVERNTPVVNLVI
jgi:hypothetical protein